MQNFTAQVIVGSGRGKDLGSPTLNLDTSQLPPDLLEGVYAAHAIIRGKTYQAVMHYGPRPVFRDVLSCEVHVLDAVVAKTPNEVTVAPSIKLREVMDFPTPDDLRMQIALDISEAKKFLNSL